MSGDRLGEESVQNGGGDTPPVLDLQLTETQHQILEALCRPAMSGNRYATPATNQEIAAEVFLSVDAVKGHLRALYRKFGVEPLPQNQKRARLVELVLKDAQLGAEQSLTERGSTPNRGNSGLRRWLLIGALGLLVLALIGLGLDGAFSGEGPRTSSPLAFKGALRSYCRLALSGEQIPVGGTVSRRAATYLEVIETMRGRFESLAAPRAPNGFLNRFGNGLTRAANFTARVAQGSPAPSGQAAADVVAELTLAAGQVQAGALGYGLGPKCVAIGDLIASSARNAARVP